MSVLIYIPLCFYFIQHTGQPSLVNADLHSTMLLLYLHRVCMTVDDHIIYIPLCFYFILRPHPRTAGSIPYLHSTMLLLYLGRKTCVSCIASNLHSTMLLLYQYAIMSTVALLLYLHSTMLLLYRVHGSQSRS